MPAIEVRAVGITDPPAYPEFANMDVLVHSKNDPWCAAVLNAGMSSGQPSVAIAVPTTGGLVIIETSLLAWLAATATMKAMAETRFGWEMPP